MRLLERIPNGDLVLQKFIGTDVPAYAILSHTWGKEEVSLQEVETGTGKNKDGWKKIEFCAKQADTDGLRYIWVDTCCIDKKDAVELSEAINSMFRLYQKAARCYVYLSDVSIQSGEQNGQVNPTWEPAFTRSRWFTRGWTLQELLAPTLIEFFSSEGARLGNKLTLEPMIHKITGIATNALKGDALSNFIIDERMSWAERRNTTLEEDKAYCLLGIFDVSMPLIYGEGGHRALRRLQEEVHKFYKGTDFEQFTVGLNLSTIPEAAQFVGRQIELAEMYRVLHGHKTRSAVVLHGLGGIGKTQLAIEYVRRHKEKYTAIFWLNANDEDSLKLSFRDIAQQVLKHHPSTSMLASVDLDENLDQVVNAVKAWLEIPKNMRWLMIFDNYDNPRTTGNHNNSAIDVRQFLPGCDHGSIIITTRSSQVSQGRRIQVQKLPNIQDGLEILSNTSGRKGIENDPAAIELVKELDGLPLALSTAGAYLEHVTTSFSDYLRLYKTSWLKLQATSPQLASYEDRSLYTTWQITFDRIQQINAASAKLLKLWAYFDKQDIWFELLRHATSADDASIRKLVEDELSFNEAVALLCSYGLVDADRTQQQFGSGGYSMHSCVHSWTVFVLNEQWDEGLASLALTCMASEIPSTNEKNWWLLQRRLLQHATRQALFIVDDKVDIVGLDWAFHSLGDLYADQGKLNEAENMYVQALQGKEKALGPDHTATLSTVNNLGILYADQDKLAEAEKMYVRALQGFEKAFGLDHTLTLSAVGNLGLLYKNQDKLVEAERIYIRALQGFEKALGSDHTSTLDTVHNLGVVYAKQGKLVEAEKMYIRALQGSEKALGLDHLSTLKTIECLGMLYADQDKLTEAEKIYIRVLRGFEKALRPDHPSILNTVDNLGIVYAKQGKLVEAEKMYVRALQGKKEALGPDHRLTLNTVNNLGLLYKSQGKLTEAEKMYIRALQGYEETLGPDNALTLNTIENLGMLYADQGKLAEAVKMCIQALQGKENTLGSDHISRLNTINNLGLLYADQGNSVGAEEMYVRALQGYEKVFGPDHTSTLSTVNNLGILYADQDKLVEAEKMYIRALRGSEKALGPDHALTLSVVNNLSTLYANQGKLAEAENMYVRALQGYEEALDVELVALYLPALKTMIALGDIFLKTDRKNMAKKIYTRALSGYTAVQGPSSRWCREIESRLQALQFTPAKIESPQNFTEAGTYRATSRVKRRRLLK